MKMQSASDTNSCFYHQNSLKCVRKTMCGNITRGSSPGRSMLLAVGQRYSKGRKTELIAVLTEFHKQGRSYRV